MKDPWLIRAWLKLHSMPFPGSGSLWTGVLIGVAISWFVVATSG